MPSSPAEGPGAVGAKGRVASKAKSPGGGTAPVQASPIFYRVEMHDLHAHLFELTLTVAKPALLQRLSLPVWIPGSYLVREFSKNLQRLRARQGERVLEPVQIDKCNWDVACGDDEPLVLSYQIYALDNSVRSAWLDAGRGFFNGTSLFLRVHGQESQTHAMQLVAHKALPHWNAACALTPVKVDRGGFGIYRANDYDELVDSPVELGPLWSGSFTVGGVCHRFVVAGATPSFDGARLLADTRRICEATIRFWHGAAGGKRSVNRPPHKSYLFMLNAVDEGYGGLEHRNSTALVCGRKDLPRLADTSLGNGPSPAASRQPDGYGTLLGLISHEYFHTWNVKRLRPAEFAGYDYGQENYTSLLWFFEGFTSYYDDLLLRRAGLLDDAAYLKLLSKSLNQVLQTPGRLVQTVAQSSFDAWVKYYRQDENSPNLTVSYYTKGAAVALCLDLSLRLHGTTNLDEVMRGLWVRCRGGPMREDDLCAVLRELSGRAWTVEIKRWVHSTRELPLKGLLEKSGVAVLKELAQTAQALGLRVSEAAGVHIKTVLRGGAAERAGFASGDEWIGVEVGAGRSATAWRMLRLDDVWLYAGARRTLTALVARDKRLLRLELGLPKAVTTWRLASRDAKKLAAWLGG